jgi:hypothetical protein
MSKTGGGRANKSGNTLEQTVEAILVTHGYAKSPNRNYGIHTVKKQPVFFRQLNIGQTIYDTNLNVDFFVYSPTKHAKGLIVECKWQQSKGSIDEKYPYLVQNLLKTKETSLIVLDGGGYKPGAKAWLKAQEEKHQKLSVHDLTGFISWVNNGGI